MTLFNSNYSDADSDTSIDVQNGSAGTGKISYYIVSDNLCVSHLSLRDDYIVGSQTINVSKTKDDSQGKRVNNIKTGLNERFNW